MPEPVINGSTLHNDVQQKIALEISDAQIRRILVYRIGSIGDTIIALPAIRAIRQNFPEAYMAFLGNAHENGYVLGQSVLPSEGLLEEWITYPTGKGRTRPSRDILRLFFQLRRGAFDTLVYLAPRGRKPSQVWRDLSFFYGAGIRRVIGHKGIDPLPHRVEGEPQPVLEHEADHLLRRLRLSGIAVPPAGHGDMDLAITESETAHARGWLYGKIGTSETTSRLIGIGPGSNWQSKSWPEERYAQLGKRLVKELNLFPIVLGGDEDVERNERLITHWGRGANAAGSLSPRHSAAALRECRLYMGNDTGTMHLAAAVGTPCVVAFSAQDWPGRWYPYGDVHIVLRHAVPCAGCMLRECDRDLKCLTLIDVEDVFQACRKLLLEPHNFANQSSQSLSVKQESRFGVLNGNGCG